MSLNILEDVDKMTSYIGRVRYYANVGFHQDYHSTDARSNDFGT